MMTPPSDQQRYPTVERLRQARALHGWTLAAFAKHVGLSVRRLRALEAGGAPITDDELATICMATGFPPVFFFRPPPPTVRWCHCRQRYTCDPCERATGAADVEAFDHCVGCGEDLCPVHCEHADGVPLETLLAADLPATTATLVKKHRQARQSFSGRLTLCAGCLAQVMAVTSITEVLPDGR